MDCLVFKMHDEIRIIVIACSHEEQEKLESNFGNIIPLEIRPTPAPADGLRPWQPSELSKIINPASGDEQLPTAEPNRSATLADAQRTAARSLVAERGAGYIPMSALPSKDDMADYLNNTQKLLLKSIGYAYSAIMSLDRLADKVASQEDENKLKAAAGVLDEAASALRWRVAEHRDGAEGGHEFQTIPCPECGYPRHVNRNIILPCQGCGRENY